MANVLVNQAAERLMDEGEALRQVGPSFRDAARVAGANTAMWTDVYAANREAVVGEVRRFARSLDAAADILESGDGVAEWNDAAQADRRRLLEPHLGEAPVHELRLTVPNRPGIVARVALALGQSRGEHRGHGAGAGRGHAHRLHDAVDRGGRRGRPRGGPDRRARLSRSRAVSRNARFAPSGPLQGSYTPPADKSISHRAALFAAMSDEPVVVRNYLESADTVATLDALRSLGAGVQEDGDGSVLVRGVGLRAPVETTGGLLNVQNSGTLMRLLPGWLAGQPGRTWTLDGDDSIRRRPVDRVAAPLIDMGARVDARDGRFPPFTIHGAELGGIEYALPVASAQVKSCVLIAGMLADGSTTVRRAGAQPRPHRAHAAPRARAVRARGPPDDRVAGGRARAGRDGGAGRPLVGGLRGGRRHAGARIAGGGQGNGPQLDPHRVLQDRRAHGRRDRVRARGRRAPRPTTSPWASSTWPRRRWRPPSVGPDEVPLAIDELTLVALLGAFADGETVVTGAEELRLKESDRISATVGGLRVSARTSRRRRTASWSAATARRSPAARSTPTAITGWPCSAPWPGWPARTAWRSVGMDASAVSYPGFEQDLAALLS